MEDSELIRNVREAYPKLGNYLYMGVMLGSHSVIFKIPNKILNWIWVIQRTPKVTHEMVQEMWQEAENVWSSQFINIIKATENPFLNIIYDCNPFDDATHLMTPHCSRSINMSVLDAAVLGKCLEKWGIENLQSALEEYRSIRLPVATEQVLYSRRVGKIKQGLTLTDVIVFYPATTDPKECWEFQQSAVPFFRHNPLKAYN